LIFRLFFAPGETFHANDRLGDTKSVLGGHVQEPIFHTLTTLNANIAKVLFNSSGKKKNEKKEKGWQPDTRNQ